MRPDRRRLNGAATRERILDAAEEMFAARGVDATSLRQVMAKAGVSISQVNYHFGTKLELLRAVFRRRVDPSQDRRRELLEAVADEPDAPVEDVLRSFLFNLLDGDTAQRRRPTQQFLARIYTDASPLARQVVAEEFDEYHQEVLALLAERLPSLTPEDLYWRLHLLLCAAAYSPLNAERMRTLSGGACDPDDPQGIASGLMPLLAAGLQAPPAQVRQNGTPSSPARRTRR